MTTKDKAKRGARRDDRWDREPTDATEDQPEHEQSPPSTENVKTDADLSDCEEQEELERLRCKSVCTEVISEKHQRMKKRNSNYPGLDFGASIFNSNTMMRFNLISNELHNIMNVQLKRAEGEVAALNHRVQVIEEDLEKTEERLKNASTNLEEAADRNDTKKGNGYGLQSNMEDDRLSQIETRLNQARIIADFAHQQYEEVARKIAKDDCDHKQQLLDGLTDDKTAS